MSAANMARKPPRAVIAAVVLLGLGSAYFLIWALNPLTRDRLIVGAVGAAAVAAFAYMLLRRMRAARDMAVMLGVAAALGGVLQIAATPVRAAALFVYGVALVATLTVPKSVRDWLRPNSHTDVTTP